MIVRSKTKKGSERNFQRLLAQESLILDATEEICRVLGSAKISRQELAKRLGKSKGFVTQVLSGERNMTLRTAADLASALDHRLQIKAVPLAKTASGGTVPIYVSIAKLHSDLRTPQTGHSGQIAAIAAGWNEFARRAAEAQANDPSSRQGRWAPATQAVECDHLQDPRTPDHEFSLSA